MNEISQVTYGMAARVFWSALWRSLVVIIPVAIIIGILSVVIPGIKDVLSLLNIMFGLWLGFTIVGIVFRKRYKRFAVCLIDNETGEERAKCWPDTLRIWWSLSWRKYLVLLIPAFMFGFIIGGILAGQDLIKAAEKRTCEREFSILQQKDQNPQTMAIAQDKYEKMNCATILTQKAPEQSTSAPAAMLLGVVVGILMLPIFVLISIKIYQIVLRKRYRMFHVRVVHLNQSVV